MVINHLLSGMILQVPPQCHVYPPENKALFTTIVP